MAPVTHAQIDAELEAGRVPFAECPGDGLVPVTVHSSRHGFRATCPMCEGTLNWYDVRWLGKTEAMQEGWAIMIGSDLDERSRYVH